MSYREISPKELSENPFSMIGDRWMLITAGDAQKANTMTASWGGVGVLWNAPVATIYVRPTRYTYEFLEREEHFSLSVLPAAYKEALQYCGKFSGRDGDKIEHCGLTTLYEGGVPYFAQADTVLLCKKKYFADIDPKNFCDPALEKHYQGDYHRMYVGEILKVLVAEA